MSFRSINPATGQTFAEYPTMSREEALALVARTDAAFDNWRREPFDARVDRLNAIAELLRQHADEGAELMAREMGKPKREGRSEMEKCAWVCEYFAQKGRKFLAPQPFPTEASKSFVSFEPLGTVLAIMPWNFPFWQVFRFAAPALLAGNTALLKHAPNVTGCAKLIERLIVAGGVPEDAFGVLLAELDVVAEIIGRPEVVAVTLTGSTRAGRSVAETAGKHLKKVVLELGGSDPYLILEDADVAATAEECVLSRLINGGQSCIAAKRFIVHKEIAQPFTKAVKTLLEGKTYGDPAEGDFDIGPMARMDLRDELHRQVTESVDKGAVPALGCEVPDGPGCFYPPSLLTDVPTDAPAFRDELFGPVATIIVAENEAEMIRIANESDYGLGAAVFTSDKARGERIAREELAAGACFVNGFVRSDPRLPFGGIKDSGYGRELSIFGIREFTNIKTVWVA